MLVHLRCAAAQIRNSFALRSSPSCPATSQTCARSAALFLHPLVPSRRPNCDNSRPIKYPNMDGIDSSLLVFSSCWVPLHVSDPLDSNRFDLHVCSNVPPSHIQIRSNDTSIVPLNEWRFSIFLGFITLWKRVDFGHINRNLVTLYLLYYEFLSKEHLFCLFLRFRCGGTPPQNTNKL